MTKANLSTRLIPTNIFPQQNEIPESFKIPYIQGRILINGKILNKGFPYKKVTSPCAHLDASGNIVYPEIGETPNVGPEIFKQAVEAAQQAWNQGQGEWPLSKLEDRIQALMQFRDQMLMQRNLICRLLMWEIAKTWTDSQAEFDRTIAYINDTIEEAKRLDRTSSQLQFAGGIMAQIRRTPLGVTLCMGPFNYPLNETFTTLIPALIMGNVLVVKIPRFGQLLWEPLLEAFANCFPAGVVNVVNGLGRDIIAPSVQSGQLDVLAFIGSSQVANQIKLSHPQPHRFRSILGLDAKNPAIIMSDADLENAVSECIKGSLSFNGQRCTAIKIIFVHASVAKKFTDMFTEKVNALKYGLPWQEGVFVTPLPDLKKINYLQEVIQEALQKGAVHCNPGFASVSSVAAVNPSNSIIAGKGPGVLSCGSLMLPAVIGNVSLDSRLAKEEQFGPVVPICEYNSIQEVIQYMVQSPFGMQASLFGQDPKQVGALIDQLANQVCRINLNTQCQRGPDVFPFTGRKGSAEGTLSVYDALRSFSIRSMVAIKQDADGKKLVREILQGDASRFLNSDFML